MAATFLAFVMPPCLATLSEKACAAAALANANASEGLWTGSSAMIVTLKRSVSRRVAPAMVAPLEPPPHRALRFYFPPRHWLFDHVDTTRFQAGDGALGGGLVP